MFSGGCQVKLVAWRWHDAYRIRRHGEAGVGGYALTALRCRWHRGRLEGCKVLGDKVAFDQ